MQERNIEQYFLEDINCKIKAKLLLELENIVPTKGWNDNSITEAALNLGLTKAYVKMIFPAHLEDIIKFYEAYYDARMLNELYKQSDLSEHGITSKVARALKIRIMSSSKDMHKQNSNYYETFRTIYSGSTNAWQTCNMIWRYAGDSAVDFNYYTKRGLLLGVYIAAIKCYISDNSSGHQQTENFINKSLANIVYLAKIPKQITKNFPSLTDIPIVRMFL